MIESIFNSFSLLVLFRYFCLGIQKFNVGKVVCHFFRSWNEFAGL